MFGNKATQFRRERGGIVLFQQDQHFTHAVGAHNTLSRTQRNFHRHVIVIFDPGFKDAA